MSITPYLKEIARGKDGARSLDAAQAEDLLRQVFAGQVSEAQLGAFLIAMRIKGETAQELGGFLAATQAYLDPTLVVALQTTAAARPLVWLPSYNGARRLPNLTPLLAGLLARQGLGVVVHGPATDPLRVTSHAVFGALGWPVVEAAQDAAAIERAASTQQPVFITIDALCPALARLLALRWQLGLRSAGHTVAKLLALPASTGAPRAVRVVNHTHPEYGTALTQFLAASRADALLLRGTEGEPVADARRLPRLDAFVAGQRIDALGVAAQGGVLSRVPQLPSAIDAATTAAFTQLALADPGTVPLPLQTQVSAITALARAVVEQPFERAA